MYQDALGVIQRDFYKDTLITKNPERIYQKLYPAHRFNQKFCIFPTTPAPELTTSALWRLIFWSVACNRKIIHSYSWGLVYLCKRKSKTNRINARKMVFREIAFNKKSEGCFTGF